MKYLIINSVCGIKSTGKLCAQEADILISQGNIVKIAYGRGRVPERYQNISFRIGNDLDIIWHVIESRFLDNSGFASRRATHKLIKFIEGYNPDVIHLHNIHGYYVNVDILFSYLKKCNKAIIWTLHDYWPITGHCSNSSFVRCDRWKTECHDCPQKNIYPKSFLLDASKKNYNKKKSIFSGIRNLTIQVPSEWLRRRVKQSFLGDYKVDVIPNVVDEEIFKPVESHFKEQSGLEGKKIILGVSTSWQERKGLNDFLQLSEIIDNEHIIVLVGLTKKQIKAMPQGIIAIPITYDMKELAKIYCAADVLVSLSKEETFGLTVLEAVKCGTPVVVYKNTACEEIANTYHGVAVEWDVQEVWKAILQIEKG